jgi:superoxide dismutase, Cu-Zn family
MRTFFTLIVAVAVVGACDDDDSVIPDPDPEEFAWEATVTGVEGFEQIQGQGAAEWTENTSEFTASLNVQGDEPGAVRPWHVHDNSCETGGGIVGPAAQYTPLTIGEDGTASAVDAIQIALDPDADYHVNLHLSADDLTVIACGDLVLVGAAG